MFGQITDLPYLSSYAAALAHYETITPLRGTDLRPICATKNGRRKKHMQIFKDTNHSIVCQLYETYVLTFYLNGDVAFCNGHYPTATTHGFVNAILRGDGVWFDTRQCRTEVLVLRDGVRRASHILDGSDSLMLRKNSEGRYEAVNPPAQYEYYARRKVLTDKRRPVLEFQNHCIAMSKLADPNENQNRGVSGTLMSRQEQYGFMADTTDREQWGILVARVLEQARFHERNVWRPSRAENHFKTQLIKAYIGDIVKCVFAGEIFEKKEVSRKTFNGNDRYINHTDRKEN